MSERTLAYWNLKRTTAEKAITNLSLMLDSPSVRDVIVTVKSLEIMDDDAIGANGYDALVEKLVQAAHDVMDTSLAMDDMMYVVRAISYGRVPYGSEWWWKIRHKDSENIDWHGQVVVGERTLESFGDAILETFYAVQP